MTYTFVVLKLSQAAFQEVRDKMVAAGYEHALDRNGDGELVDMHGIAVQAETP
jgi:hypothetical protein